MMIIFLYYAYRIQKTILCITKTTNVNKINKCIKDF